MVNEREANIMCIVRRFYRTRVSKDIMTSIYIQFCR